MTKWIIGVVVVLAVAGGAWWYFTNRPSAQEQMAQDTTAMQQPQAPDTSDAALVQDTASIDAQLKSYDAEQQ